MSTTESLDVVVVGAGVVGLACARALARAGRDVLVIEGEARPGMHTSSRNSEVIHAGIYYPRDSLKARLCVEGKEKLYAYCAARGVAHKRIGKIIVATETDEMPKLEAYLVKARENGVNDLTWLTQAEIARLEPAVRAVGGLMSPSTGIVDSHELMRCLREDAEAAGATLLYRTSVRGGVADERGVTIHVEGEAPMTVSARLLVNCAGLFAQRLTHALENFPKAAIPPIHYAKGHYFTLAGPSPFSRLVYPVPVPGGLGTHVTLDMAGQVRFGPDVAWLDDVDYTFDESRAGAFYASIRRYYPDLPDGALAPGYTGIRPKLGGPGSGDHDFVISGPADHGMPGVVNLFGIESPGLTACLAIADRVLAKGEAVA